MSVPCTFLLLIISVPCAFLLLVMYVHTKPVYNTGVHKTGLQYRCTQNKFTAQVYIKPASIRAVHRTKLEYTLDWICYETFCLTAKNKPLWVKVIFQVNWISWKLDSFMSRKDSLMQPSSDLDLDQSLPFTWDSPGDGIKPDLPGTVWPNYSVWKWHEVFGFTKSIFRDTLLWFVWIHCFLNNTRIS